MAKIRPLSSNARRDDFTESCGVVDSTYTSGDVSHSVESKEIFGNPDVLIDPERDVIRNDVYTRRGVIKLVLPVMNAFVVGQNADLITKLFARGEDDKVDSAMKNELRAYSGGMRVYDVIEKKTVPYNEYMSTIYDPERHIIGCKYIERLLEEFNPEEELESMLRRLVCATLKRMKISLSESQVVITRVGGEVWLVDDYYANVGIEFDAAMFACLFTETVTKMFSGKTNRLLLLLSLRDNGMDDILATVQSKVMVIPSGYRPKYRKMRDSLTVAYNDIVILNEQLTQCMSGYNVNLREIVDKYAKLITAVDTVQYKNRDKFNKNHQAILERIKGKEGLIRSKMLGVRSDYSGRAVIIVDPEMSLDTIGIPITMAEKLYELRALEKYGEHKDNAARLLSSNPYKKEKLREYVREVADYVVPGRQPTLYRLGIQGFKVKILEEGHAIVLNPLCTPAFNADFDGDQMHIDVPISKEAREEVEKLMLITNNLYLGRSGECHIAPRQELIYGLWKANTAEPTGRYIQNVGSIEDLLTALKAKECDIIDYTTFLGKQMTIGECAIRMCLPEEYKDIALGIKPLQKEGNGVKSGIVSEGWFKVFLGKLGEGDKDVFVTTVNRLVRLSFIVAEQWCPSIPVLNYPDIKPLINDFLESTRVRESYFNRGFEVSSDFSVYYDEECDKLKKQAIKLIVDSFAESNKTVPNGFYEMMASGARGKADNLLQTFGMKGRVSKNSVESFNAIISSSLVEQLSSLESLVCSFGGRQGLIDKSIETYGPGYLSRQMQHVTSPVVITSEDCGTKDGLLITFDGVCEVLGGNVMIGDDQLDDQEIKKFVCKILLGRYIVGEDDEIKTEEQAKRMYTKYVMDIHGNPDDTVTVDKKPGLKLRSPITCKNPCCVKCYGVYLGTRKEVAVGTPVGFEAATSIGEPGTQLTMKNFQSGGIAGQKNLTSSYSTLEDYLHMQDLAEAAKKYNNNVYNHDWISDVEGTVQAVGMGDGTKKVVIRDTKGKSINIPDIKYPENKKLKSYVKVGDSILEKQEDFNMKDVLTVRGFDYAVRYLVLFLYNLFNKEVEVNLKHFEVLVSGMIMYVCLRGNEHFKTGHYYNNIEYWSNDRTGCEFTRRLMNIKDVPIFRDDVFSGIAYERIAESAERSIISSGKDDLKLPIVRYMFGLKENFGSAVPGYLDKRNG